MFIYYIKEIKNRLFLLSLTWVSTLICSYYYKENILFLCIKPSLFYFKDSSFYFIFTNLTEVFYTYLNLMYFIANNLTCILLIYHILIFLHLGLTLKEYKKFKFIILSSFFSWVFYILYINSYVFKLCLEFFINFQNSNDNSLSFFFEAKFNEYFNFFLLFYKMCLFFYLVIVCILLIFEIYNKKTLKKTRKIFHFFIFLIATLLTPPDIISQLCFSIIFIFIFEILLYISFLNKNW